MSIFGALLLEPTRANYVNVREFGARGDGVSDDRGAIQAAVDYLAKVGGGTLFFPTGIYRCARAPTLQPLDTSIQRNYSVRITTPGITLEGESWDAVILQDNPWTTPIFYEIGTKGDTRALGNVLVHRLKFKGDTSHQLVPVTRQYALDSGLVGALLGIWGTANLPLIKNIVVRDCLFEDGNKGLTLYLAYLDDVLVENCSIIHFKDFQMFNSVRYATVPGETANLNAPPTVDGLSPGIGDRILLKDQTNKRENGIYVVQGTAPYLRRAPDGDSSEELDSLRVVVTDGATNKARIFKVDKLQTKLPISFPLRAINPDSDFVLIEDDVVHAGTATYAKAATTTAFQYWPPSGLLTIDDVPLNANDVVLVKNQDTLPQQNGLYLVQTGGWVRAATATDESALLQLRVFVQQGTVYRLTFWQLRPTRGPIVVEAKVGTPLRFMRTNAISTAVVGVQPTPVDIGQSYANGLMSLSDGTQISRGDRVLLTGQIDPNQNGIWLLDSFQSGFVLFRAPDFGGLVTYDLVDKFLVQPMSGSDPERYYALDNPPADVGTKALSFVQQGSPGVPSVMSTSPEVAHLRFLGNHFNGDVSDQGSRFGVDGILWHRVGQSLVANGNTVLNYKLEGIQFGVAQATLNGNNFRTTKHYGSSTVAIDMVPNEDSGRVLSVEATGNNCEGSAFMFTGQPSYYSFTQNPIDYNICGNRILGLPVLAENALRLYRARIVNLRNNLIDQSTGPAIVVLAAVKAMRLKDTDFDTTTGTATSGQIDVKDNLLLKDGERVFFSAYIPLNANSLNLAGILPQELSGSVVYYVRRVTGSPSKIQLFTDPSLLDVYRVQRFLTGGTPGGTPLQNPGYHTLLYGNWGCVFSMIGNTMLGTVRGSQRKGIYIGVGAGNQQGFGFTFSIQGSSTPFESYSVPAGAAFFGCSMIGDNLLSATDGHVITARPVVKIKVPLVMFNNLGFNESSGRIAVSVNLLESIGAGSYELQGPYDDLEVLTL